MKIPTIIFRLAERCFGFIFLGIFFGLAIGILCGGMMGFITGIARWSFELFRPSLTNQGLFTLLFFGAWVGVIYGAVFGMMSGAIIFPILQMVLVWRLVRRVDADELNLAANVAAYAGFRGALRGALTCSLCGGLSGILFGLLAASIGNGATVSHGTLEEIFDLGGSFFYGSIGGFVIGFLAGAFIGGLNPHHFWFNAPLKLVWKAIRQREFRPEVLSTWHEL